MSVKIFVSSISTDIEKTGTLGYAIQKIEFLGIPGGVVPQTKSKYLSTSTNITTNWHPSLYCLKN